MEVEEGGAQAPQHASDPGEGEEEDYAEVIRRKKEKLAQGTLEEYTSRLSGLELVKNQQLADVDKQFEQEMERLRKLHEYERRAAEQSFLTACNTVRDEIAQQLEEEARRCSERSGPVSRSSSRVTRRLRSKARAEAEEEAERLGRRTDTVAGRLMSDILTEEEVAEDLQAIHGDWMARAATYCDSRDRGDVFVENGRLQIGELGFMVGSPVIVTSELTNEVFAGVLDSITPHEVILRHGDGTRSRIYVAHIKLQRCTIRHDMSHMAPTMYPGRWT